MTTTTPATLDQLDLVEQLNREHELAEGAWGEALEHACRAGRLLLEAKTRCGHGKWMGWLEANFSGTRRTATNYMRVADRWQELSNGKHVSHLTLRGALNLLAAPRETTEDEAPKILTGPWDLEANQALIRWMDVESRAIEAEGRRYEFLVDHPDVTLSELVDASRELLKLQNRAAEIRLRAERELGRILNGDYGNADLYRTLLEHPELFPEFQRMCDARTAELEASEVARPRTDPEAAA